jgi:uncharacterized protein
MTVVALFLVLLFAITWPLGLFVTPVAMAHGQLAFLAAFLPMVWAPTFIALGLVRYTEGAAAVRQELRARLSMGSGVGTLLIAGASPLIVGAMAISVARAAGDGAPFIPPTALAVSIGIQIISGSTGEELGWRGFLLPRLRARLGPTGAAVAMALLWALWHVPAFYTPGMPHRFMPMGTTLAAIALFGVFLAALFFRGGNSVLPTMAAHIALNVILGIGGVNLASVTFWRVFAALTAPIALATLMWRGTRDRPDQRAVA